MMVRRAKGGFATEHPLRGVELRLLGRLRRENPDAAYVLPRLTAAPHRAARFSHPDLAAASRAIPSESARVLRRTTLRHAAATFPLPREVKDGPGAVCLYLQRARKAQIHGLRCGNGCKDRGVRSASGRALNRRQVHWRAIGRCPSIDDAPRAKNLAVRIANAVYQGIDFPALVLENLGIELGERIRAASQHRACNTHKQGHDPAHSPSLTQRVGDRHRLRFYSSPAGCAGAATACKPARP
jgi:hypothetical protein